MDDLLFRALEQKYGIRVIFVSYRAREDGLIRFRAALRHEIESGFTQLSVLSIRPVGRKEIFIVKGLQR